MNIHVPTRTGHICVNKIISQVELVTFENTHALKSFQDLKHVFAIYYNGKLIHIFKQNICFYSGMKQLKQK
jgi:hypothetical protein